MSIVHYQMQRCGLLRHYNDSKAFIEHSNDTDGINENIEEYNLND